MINFIEHLKKLILNFIFNRRFIGKKNLSALNNFIGYGNPSANLWFISLEEGGGYCETNEEEEIEPRCKEKELERLKIFKWKYSLNNFSPFYISNEDFSEFYEKYPEEKAKSLTDTSYKNYCAIYNHFNSPNISIENIGEPNIDLFISNLFPLSRKTTKSKYDKFVREFIFDGDFTEWKKNYWNERKENISKFFHKIIDRNKRLTILFFGPDPDYGFNEILNMISGETIKLEFQKKIVHQNLTVLQAYHPGQTNTYNKKFNVEQVIQLLGE